MKKLLFVFLILSGCVFGVPTEAEAMDTSMPEPSPNAELPRFEVPIEEPMASLELHPVWHPRSHPQGTLLVDHDREIWMVTRDGVRQPVSGDDTLGLISLDEHDAVAMTLEEEACLVPDESEHWGPGNEAWWPVWGPDEEDSGPFIIDWDRHTRYRTSIAALESWGYYWRWMDWFDGGADEWASYTDASATIGIRDGTLARTELATYYVVHGRSYAFLPASVATDAGYTDTHVLRLTEAQLRDHAPAATFLDRSSFERCPAMETP